MIRKLIKKNPILTNLLALVIGLLFLATMVLNAWMTADDACRGRWKITKLAAKYTTDGCMVELSPDRWINETRLEKDIHLTITVK